MHPPTTSDDKQIRVTILGSLYSYSATSTGCVGGGRGGPNSCMLIRGFADFFEHAAVLAPVRKCHCQCGKCLTCILLGHIPSQFVPFCCLGTVLLCLAPLNGRTVPLHILWRAQKGVTSGDTLNPNPKPETHMICAILFIAMGINYYGFYYRYFFDCCIYSAKTRPLVMEALHPKSILITCI